MPARQTWRRFRPPRVPGPTTELRRTSSKSSKTSPPSFRILPSRARRPPMKAQFPAWLWGLGGLLMAVVGFTAAIVEILNYFEIKPRDLAGWAASKVDAIVVSANEAGRSR